MRVAAFAFALAIAGVCLTSASAHTTFAGDGSGTMTADPVAVSASSSIAVNLTYRPATGGMSDGAVSVTVPPGWPTPQTTAQHSPGYTQAVAGSVFVNVSVSGRTVTASGITLGAGQPGQRVLITYGGPATAPSATGSQVWQTAERSTAGGTLTPLADLPSIDVVAADGSGTTTPQPQAVPANYPTTLQFTYTAATGGLHEGVVKLRVPEGWPPPSPTPSDPGYATASAGTFAVDGTTGWMTDSNLTLASGASMVITFGSTAGGGPGASGQVGVPQDLSHWEVQEQSSEKGKLTNGSLVDVTIAAPDGSGTLQPSLTAVTPTRHGQTVQLAYTPAQGGLSNCIVAVDVPAGWSAPSTTGADPGYVTANAGHVEVSGRTVTVSQLSRTARFTITYGSKAQGGPGATSPAAIGPGTWDTEEQSTAGSNLTALAQSPETTVVSPDGSGSMTTNKTRFAVGSTDQSLYFKYTAATGGISNGELTLTVPTGWSQPSTSTAAPGYVTAYGHTVQISGRTIIVPGVTLSAGQSITIVYGQRKDGGPGASAPTTAVSQTWASKARSTTAGNPFALASSPVINVS